MIKKINDNNDLMNACNNIVTIYYDHHDICSTIWSQMVHNMISYSQLSLHRIVQYYSIKQCRTIEKTIGVKNSWLEL